MKEYINEKLVVIRGGGDLGTGVALTLFNAGYIVLILETKCPIAVRRKVAFSEAVYENEVIIEGVKGVITQSLNEIYNCIAKKYISIFVDEKANILNKLKPIALVDALVAKKNFGTNKKMAPITIALGPGFVAGVDAVAVIETNRGQALGKVIYDGSTSKNTRQPAPVLGFKRERVLWAPVSGYINVIKDIGNIVKKGEVVAEINGIHIRSKISGFVRGMIHPGIYVREGLKIADIDPRIDRLDLCNSVSDKSYIIGKSVLNVLEVLSARKPNNKIIEWYLI
jgi:xanthine dehydrogenase accessory factor